MALLALAVLLLPQSGEREHAFVELAAQQRSIFVGQPVRLTIRIGVEKEYLRHNLLQLFTRPLDVPVQLELPWSAEAADMPALGPTFALGEEIVRPTRSREEPRAGAAWVVLELERGFQPEGPGTLEIAGPVLHFAFATRFDEDLVSGSVPLDRQSGEVRGAPLAIEVLPLPDEGRPAGFVNAVGQFTLEARAEPRELAVGERLALTLTIAGEGNLARLAPPRLDHLAGLHLLGLREEALPGSRTLRCDLLVESAKAREVPVIALDFFDPEARAYRRASTQPIALAIRVRVGATIEAKPTLYALLGLLALATLAIVWLVRRRRA